MVTRVQRLTPVFGARTLAAHADAKLSALSGAFGFEDRRREIRRCLLTMLGIHSGRPVDHLPAWTSDICDDSGPFEFSISLNRTQTSLRVLVETGAATPVLADMQASAEAMTDQLAAEFGVPLDRLHAVAPLFRSEAESAQFARWHAVGFDRSGERALKVYLNPQINGPEAAPGIVREALTRLGLAHAVPRIRDVLARDEADELKYFSLDLSNDRRARVKVYVRHHGLTLSELEAALEGCRGIAPGEATDFCRRMTGRDGRYDTKPIITCFSWVEGEPLPAATLHVPIRGYASDDQVAFDRICAYMTSRGIPTADYEAGIPAFAGRRLDAGVGMQSYASIKGSEQGCNVTVYLVPETYQVRPPAQTSHLGIAGSNPP